ncbi:hypothetical protein CB0940_08416 [Cercospora beticola]|uniref:Lysine-specific metallo-endopeptidase domain-containing protein n=1 Tax=Cercospora beticola TaxID=122368 RepID=A0A2G5HP61_CERBT|nr:hypothetical protein CB0940_08416 [Cercospora beticola]PIA94347.1 hypothetical protein CB0940_08416 [Cercospora beticola]WPB04992.1 hypothetical protein RHO25_009640 [Cercospora beticola]CAK1364770.1 unnamed protein product [Cercospora beticola]
MAALVTSATSILGSSLPTPLPSLSVTGISPPVSKISVAGPANSDVRRIVECDAVQTQVVTETLSLVQERMHHLMAKHDRELSDPASHTRRLLELFFGKGLTEEQLGFITDKLHRVITEAGQPTYHCKNSCPPNVVAQYTWNGNRFNDTRDKNIHFCPSFFSSRKDFGLEKGSWLQALYAIHEGIHSIVIPESPNDIGDTPGYWSETGAQPTGPAIVAYGHILTEQLAAYSSEAAMFNAENYRQYVEFLYEADTTGKVQEADGKVHYGEPPAWTTIWKGHMRTSTVALGAPTPTPTATEQPTAAMLTTSETTAAAMAGIVFRIPPRVVPKVRPGSKPQSSDAVSTAGEHLKVWWFAYGLAGLAGFMWVVM